MSKDSLDLFSDGDHKKKKKKEEGQEKKDKKEKPKKPGKHQEKKKKDLVIKDDNWKTPGEEKKT